MAASARGDEFSGGLGCWLCIQVTMVAHTVDSSAEWLPPDCYLMYVAVQSRGTPLWRAYI